MKNSIEDVLMLALSSPITDLKSESAIGVEQRVGIVFAINELAKAIRYHGDKVLEAEQLKKSA